MEKMKEIISEIKKEIIDAKDDIFISGLVVALFLSYLIGEITDVLFVGVITILFVLLIMLEDMRKKL